MHSLSLMWEKEHNHTKKFPLQPVRQCPIRHAPESTEKDAVTGPCWAVRKTKPCLASGHLLISMIIFLWMLISLLVTLLKLMSIESVMPSTISSSAIPFSSCLRSFPPSGSFPVSQFFASGGQSIGVLASTSVLPMNNQDWFPSGWTGWISLQSKGLSRVYSNTTVQKPQFFGTQLSLCPNSHIHIWLLEKT